MTMSLGRKKACRIENVYDKDGFLTRKRLVEDLKYRLFVGLVAGLFAVLIGLGWPLALIVFCIVASVDLNPKTRINVND